MKDFPKFIGVDYGSKLAGTTAVCFCQDEQFHFFQSEKKKDADAFLEGMIERLSPKYVFLDAPLSLPGAYFGKSEDYFYRKGDRAVRAMSPMFLGGLTARAMKLQSSFEKKEIQTLEVYPSQLLKVLFPERVFKKSNYEVEVIFECLKPKLPFSIETLPADSHQLDSLLCWLSGYRFFRKEGVFYGDEEEGGIWV